MMEFLNGLGIDYNTLVLTILGAVCTYVLLPLGKKIKEYFDAKKLDCYSQMLYDTVSKTVKDLSETVVKEIKGTDKWDEAKIAEIKEIAKTKIIQNLTTSAYHFLKVSNEDLEEWMGSLIETALFELKKKEGNKK